MWGQMRTIAREAVFQIALRNYSEQIGGKVSLYVILVTGVWGGYIQSSTHFCRRLLLVTRSRHHHERF